MLKNTKLRNRLRNLHSFFNFSNWLSIINTKLKKSARRSVMKSKNVVTFGEVMMRLSTPAFSRFTQASSFNVQFGGAEANVAISLARLGISATHVTRFPDSDLGAAANQVLRSHGVDTSRVVFGNERMGLYFLENGSMQRASRIIYDRVNSAFANLKKEDFDWKEILKDASWFHYTGITPAISQNAANACLEAVSVAFDFGLKISGDINYRRNLWQYGKSARDVMPALMEKTHVIVAGKTDLENCAGIRANNFQEACARAFNQFGNLEKIAATERQSMSASHNKLQGVLFDGSYLIRSQEYDLTHIVDRIGGGDAFIAGLIYAMIEQRGDQDALEFATAASALKHSIEGDANRASVSEIEGLLKGIHVGQLLR
jgi:2-dehydro-3-deoxygluconokinase